MIFVYLQHKIKVMDKATLLEKVKKQGFSHEQLLNWITSLPGSSITRKPSFNRVGDIYIHPVFQHPYVLLEKQEGYWICGLITSESKFPDILEKCRSRFFEGYFTKTLFTASEIHGSFMNNYDNTRHLKQVIERLRKIL